ncbi:MAG TPA: hypothetical protein VIV12_18795 [Streptosporangiaceae bacterium]
MQQPHAHTDARAARPAASRLAWLGLGLFTAAFAVFEVVKHGPGAVPFYNAAHRVWGPLALLVACTFWIDSAALFTGALAHKVTTNFRSISNCTINPCMT